MLRELHVKNLAVLEAASVELGEGLNVLTGETGAGKSIVVDSLLLLSGVRASGELIRTGADTLTASGIFSPVPKPVAEILAERGLRDEADDADELVVRREVNREGRNRVYLDDRPATAALLAEIAPHLLRIHGQREELALVDPALQRVWLDRSGGGEAVRLAAAVEAAFAAWRKLAIRLADLSGNERERRERLDLLRFQAREIDAAQVHAGEEEELTAERGLLRNVERVTNALGGAFALVFDDEGAASERLARAADLLGEAAEWEPEVEEWVRELDEARIRTEEVARAVRDRLDGLEADPRRLDAVEERLAALERLLAKYRVGSRELLELRSEIDEEIARLEGAEEDRGDLEAQAAEARERYREAALALSEARRRWGVELAERLAAELGDLGLGKARFEVGMEPRRRSGSGLEIGGEEVDFGPHGVDHVVYRFAANPGDEPAPLAKVASGGELARLYLALQLATLPRQETAEEARESATLVFDEVDVGVSGAQAAAIGRKLQRLAGTAQILAVTHLAQVASCADSHYRVTKNVAGGRAATLVEALEAEERTREVARLLAGSELTELSLSHARELIADSSREAAAGPAAGNGE